MRCKLPFVVADYSPDAKIKGKLPGIRHHGKFASIVSKVPIRVYDDRDCLNQIPLSEESEDESASEVSIGIRRENQSVSRTFYKGAPDAFEKAKKPMEKGLIDERLIELLQRLPKNKRISLRI